jgi:hypothetical protein
MITGKEFLRLEEKLRNISGEAAARTRIGRLYYGVYLEYRAFCEDFLAFSRQNLAQEHQIVRNLIVPIDTHAADILQNLRVARNQADYNLDIDAKTIDVLLNDSVTAADLAMVRLTRMRSNYEQL